MSFDLNLLLRENIKTLKPYSSARDEFHGEAKVYLDANENSLGSPVQPNYNRYPDPHQLAVKRKLSEIKGIPVENIFLGNGSDECIDVLYRAFCDPGKDNVIICPPTYGMYEVSANINDVAIKRVNLLPNFQLDIHGIEHAIDDNTKMVFICSPNNPTANTIDHDDIEVLLNNYFGIVVIDEAYINFSRFRSLTMRLNDYPNLVVLQTLSKAWGLAALRVGMAFASTSIIDIMNKIKPPYNINEASQQIALESLGKLDEVKKMIGELVTEREFLEDKLPGSKLVQHVYPSDANFLLVKMTEAKKIYDYLIGKGIVVRDRSKVELCDNCLRITVGTRKENLELISALENY